MRTSRHAFSCLLRRYEGGGCLNESIWTNKEDVLGRNQFGQEITPVQPQVYLGAQTSYEQVDLYDRTSSEQVDLGAQTSLCTQVKLCHYNERNLCFCQKLYQISIKQEK